MLTTLIGSLLAGLLGTPHCAAMCGGFAAACSTQKQPVSRTVTYSLGRLTTYVALGALAGSVGQQLHELRLVGLVMAAVFLVYFAARVAGFVPESAPRIPGLPRLIGRARGAGGVGGGYLLGASTALLPCGLVYAALSLPVVAASPWWGMASMALFWAGTVPGLVGIAVLGSRIPRTGPRMRVALALAVLVTGTMGLVQRAPVDNEGVPDCCAHEE